MQNLTLVKSVEWTGDGVVLASSFDSRHRLCRLVQKGPGDQAVEVDGVVRAVPTHWAQHVKRIAWLGGDEILLWPVCLPAQHPSYVGKIGPIQTEMLNIGYPLDIFDDRHFLVCTASEENFVPDTDIQDQSDLISAFSYPGIVRVARFIEPFMKKFSHTRYLEVETGCSMET